jgi:hypothetical protein
VCYVLRMSMTAERSNDVEINSAAEDETARGRTFDGLGCGERFGGVRHVLRAERLKKAGEFLVLPRHAARLIDPAITAVKFGKR